MARGHIAELGLGGERCELYLCIFCAHCGGVYRAICVSCTPAGMLLLAFFGDRWFCMLPAHSKHAFTAARSCYAIFPHVIILCVLPCRTYGSFSARSSSRTLVLRRTVACGVCLVAACVAAVALARGSISRANLSEVCECSVAFVLDWYASIRVHPFMRERGAVSCAQSHGCILVCIR